MDFGDFMSLAVFVGGIVVIVRTLAEVHQRKLAVQEREIELALQQKVGSPANATIERLEERIRVLERIATDKSENVAAQIEALRDERVALSAPARETV